MPELLYTCPECGAPAKFYAELHADRSPGYVYTPSEELEEAQRKHQGALERHSRCILARRELEERLEATLLAAPATLPEEPPDWMIMAVGTAIDDAAAYDRQLNITYGAQLTAIKTFRKRYAAECKKEQSK